MAKRFHCAKLKCRTQPAMFVCFSLRHQEKRFERRARKEPEVLGFSKNMKNGTKRPHWLAVSEDLNWRVSLSKSAKASAFTNVTARLIGFESLRVAVGLPCESHGKCKKLARPKRFQNS